jgi:hypothetical protein
MPSIAQVVGGGSCLLGAGYLLYDATVNTAASPTPKVGDEKQKKSGALAAGSKYLLLASVAVVVAVCTVTLVDSEDNILAVAKVKTKRGAPKTTSWYPNPNEAPRKDAAAKKQLAQLLQIKAQQGNYGWFRYCLALYKFR